MQYSICKRGCDPYIYRQVLKCIMSLYIYKYFSSMFLKIFVILNLIGKKAQKLYFREEKK